MTLVEPLKRSISPIHEIEHLLEHRGIRAVYQPIVEIESGRPVAYEALARGPAGSALERPDLMFAAADEAGLREELEWECRGAALSGAMQASLTREEALFVNLEPNLLGRALPEWLEALGEAARARLEICVELTERALTADPTLLLSAVAELRAAGYRIALDDVGVDPQSIALIPFVSPDVVKLDLSIVQHAPSAAIAEVVHAVNAEAERTGTLIVAEGIETEEHRERALAMGATHAQGWLFGKPNELEAARAEPGPTLFGRDRVDDPRTELTPFDLVAEERPVRTGNKRLLFALSREIEAHAKAQGASAVVLANFQEAQHFTAASARLYSDLAEGAAMIGALGAGLTPSPAPGVRGADIGENATLRREWDVAVIGPHFAVAFVARELDAGRPVVDMDREFAFTITYERDLAVSAARALMRQVTAASAPG